MKHIQSERYAEWYANDYFCKILETTSKAHTTHEIG